MVDEIFQGTNVGFKAQDSSWVTDIIHFLHVRGSVFFQRDGHGHFKSGLSSFSHLSKSDVSWKGCFAQHGLLSPNAFHWNLYPTLFLYVAVML